MYQDNNFEIIEFNGLAIEKLIVCYDADEPKDVFAIYLKIQNKKWQCFFLDAGIAFCDERKEIETDDDAYLFIDETVKLGLKNSRIKKIYAKPDHNNTKVTIETLDQKIHLQCKNSKVFDDEHVEIVRERNSI